MPTYEYRCENGHQFEAFHKMSDDPIDVCPECGAPAERKISSGAGLVFKGSGFYITDYKRAAEKKSRDAQKKSGDGEKKAGHGEKKAADAGGGGGSKESTESGSGKSASDGSGKALGSGGSKSGD